MEESKNPKLKLKLLIEKKSMKVLFAEANKEFVDFLFSLMSLPLGTVVKLLTQDVMVGSLGDLFGSIESLDNTYLQSSENIKSILNPKPATIAFKNPLLLSNCESVNRKAYMCLNQIHNHNNSASMFPSPSSSSMFSSPTSASKFRSPSSASMFSSPTSASKFPSPSSASMFSSPSSAGMFTSPTTPTTYTSYTAYHPYMSDVPNTACPDCQKPMNYQLKLVYSNSANQELAAGGGFVKGVVNYMVMDNLEVKPLSTISSIALINSFNIQDLSSLEEMVVDVGATQALKLLRASLESKNVLTSVFLDKKEAN